MRMLWKEFCIERNRNRPLKKKVSRYENGLSQAMFPASLFLGSLGPLGLLALVVLLVVGLIIIIVIVKILFFILPAAVVALIVWLISGGNEVLAGIAFIAIAVLSILKR